MKVNTDSSGFYNKKVLRARDTYFTSHTATDNTTALLVNYAVKHMKLVRGKSLLDIGTGNGFVLTEIIKHLDNFDEFELNGVDLSDNMIAEAKIRCENYSHIKIVKADNFKLPFPDNTFDVVTNKLATNFSISEVFRVLRNDGLFVFKEYGLFKGFGGVSELFVGRIKIKDPLVYLQELRQYGWKNMLFNQFFFERVYTKEELINIFSMAPIINDFDPVKDLKTIENAHKNGNIKVLADPFLIVALKK